MNISYKMCCIFLMNSKECYYIKTCLPKNLSCRTNNTKENSDKSISSAGNIFMDKKLELIIEDLPTL